MLGVIWFFICCCALVRISSNRGDTENAEEARRSKLQGTSAEEAEARCAAASELGASGSDDELVGEEFLPGPGGFVGEAFQGSDRQRAFPAGEGFSVWVG
jgi:hypothetical protein